MSHVTVNLFSNDADLLTVWEYCISFSRLFLNSTDFLLSKIYQFDSIKMFSLRSCFMETFLQNKKNDAYTQSEQQTFYLATCHEREQALKEVTFLLKMRLKRRRKGSFIFWTRGASEVKMLPHIAS